MRGLYRSQGRHTVEPSVGAKRVRWWESTWRPTGRCQDLRAFVSGVRVVAQTSPPSHPWRGSRANLGRAVWEGCQCRRWAEGLLGRLCRASAPRAKLAGVIQPLKYGLPKQRGCLLVESSDFEEVGHWDPQKPRG